MEKAKLSLKTKIGAGVADLGGNIFFSIISYWLLYFLTDSVGMSAAIAGSAILVGKIWDAVIDPFIGYISDNTITRMGRRRPYMVGPLFPLLLFIILLFSKLGITNQTTLFIYVTITFCLVNTAYSLIFIPYYAVFTELSRDYNERTSLMAYRMAFALIGNILGSILALPIISLFPNRDMGFVGMAVIVWVIIGITVLISFFVIKEPKHIKGVGPKPLGLWKSYVETAKNKPFMIYLTAMCAYFIGLVMMQGAIVYFFKYIYNNEGLSVIGILAFAVPSILFIPIVGIISKKVGKKKAWVIGLIMNCLGGILLFLSPNLGGFPVSIIGLIIIGVGGAFSAVLAGAILPDIIEYDYLKTNRRREGVYSGLTLLIQQLGLAVGSASVGWALGAFGYQPDIAQNAGVLIGIRLLVGIGPAILCLISIIAISFYPITEDKYNEILEKIKDRDQQAANLEPSQNK